MKKVSIIIPIYNVEEYLSQCLDSIVNQTYSNLEVILINDGSTDNCLEICNKYINKYNWKLINKKNGGLSSARNAGLKEFTGDYVYFIDSDDWIKEDMIEVLVSLLENKKADIVECGIYWVYDNEIKIDNSDNDYLMNRKEVISSYLLQTKKIHSAVWNKLYKKEIFNGLFFDEVKLHEDGYFMYKALYNVKNFYLSSYTGYYYRQNREGSIMSTAIKPKNIIDVTDLMYKRNIFFREKEEYDLAEMSESYYYRTTLTNYITSVNILKDKDLILMLNNILLSSKKNIFSNKYLKIKKLKFLLFFYFKPVFNYIYLNKKGDI